MSIDEITQLLLVSFPGAVVNVTGEDAYFSVDIISPEFANQSRFNRQKKVLSCVKDRITSGEIHAFSVQAFTQDEWNRTGSSLTVI